MSLRDQIAASIPKPQPINVEGWGDGVYCRKLNGKGAMGFYALQSKAEPIEVMFYLIALCICDKDGKREFADENDALLIDQPIERIVSAFTECCKANGFNQDDSEKKE